MPTPQGVADQVAVLGIPSVRAYLANWLATHAWTPEEMASEFGAAPATVSRGWLDQQLGPARLRNTVMITRCPPSAAFPI
jgi:predicted transcriptional regulator